MGGNRFRSFTVSHRETDLWIGVTGGNGLHRLAGCALDRIKALRRTIDAYGKHDRRFLSSMAPYGSEDTLPPLVARMLDYGQRAGVGPMASVAGVFAQEIGESLKGECGIDECIVENGGDIYMDISEPVNVSIFAGSSPLSNLIMLAVDPVFSPLGICTSSGTIGHSYSKGRADAVTVACGYAGLADAFATAFCNQVFEKEDIVRMLKKSEEMQEILHTLIIVGDRIGLQGHFGIKTLSA